MTWFARHEPYPAECQLVVTYRQADRFWTLQFIEGGLFLAIAAAVLARPSGCCTGAPQDGGPRVKLQPTRMPIGRRTQPSEGGDHRRGLTQAHRQLGDRRETVPVKRKPNKAVLAALAVAHVAVTSLTWRDLRYRPAERVRGNKTFWRVASTLNMGNSAVYWLLGRRPARRR